MLPHTRLICENRLYRLSEFLSYPVFIGFMRHADKLTNRLRIHRIHIGLSLKGRTLLQQHQIRKPKSSLFPLRLFHSLRCPQPLIMRQHSILQHDSIRRQIISSWLLSILDRGFKAFPTITDSLLPAEILLCQQ